VRDFFPIKIDLHPNPPTAIADIHGFATDTIRTRRRQSVSTAENRDDILSQFVAGDDEHGDEAFRYVVLSFLIAGRETTSSAQERAAGTFVLQGCRSVCFIQPTPPWLYSYWSLKEVHRARLGILLRHLKSAIWYSTAGNRARRAWTMEEPADAVDGAPDARPPDPALSSSYSWPPATSVVDMELLNFASDEFLTSLLDFSLF
jgi:hypothetical protein